MLKRVALWFGVLGAVSVCAGAMLSGVAAEDKRKPVVIDGVSYADHGIKDVRNVSRLELEADDYYFSPTFLRGNPGQTLTLVMESDIPPKGKLQFDVTFPASGVLIFSCKYHRTLGMNGQLRVGGGAPVGAR